LVVGWLRPRRTPPPEDILPPRVFSADGLH
jgi:hypothetical protein